MWVPDVSCKDKGCAGKDKYNSKLSSSYKANGYPIQISYGTGSMTGVLDVDDFHLAGIKISQGTFGAATSLADFFAGQPMDGILGTLQKLESHHFFSLIPIQFSILTSKTLLIDFSFLRPSLSFK